MSNMRLLCRPLLGVLVSFPLGCNASSLRTTTFHERVLPQQPTQPITQQTAASPVPSEITLVSAEEPAAAATTASTPAAATTASLPPATDGRVARGPLTLTDAVALARQIQPRLRVYLEGVAQAKGAETMAYAPYLPGVSAGYSVGGFEFNAGGPNLAYGAGTPNFTFLPFSGSIPLGLNLSTGYEMAELRVQWLITDFGRRAGRYHQAQIGVSVAELQTDRAYQTVENDVALAYYQVLRTRSLKRIAEEAVRRTEDEVEVAQKLAKGGVVEREKVLRAEVALAQAKRAFNATDAASVVALSGLNLAIGLNVWAPTEIVTPKDLPEYKLTLADCLNQAVANRRELTVARLGIEAAQQGRQVSRADFRPKVVAGGALLDSQQAATRAHSDLAVGFIKLEWELFEGGKRVGELRIADAKLRAAAAQAESLADAIAFQVNDSYHHMTVARRGVELSKPAVEQAHEAYRLLRARADKGDATPSEVIEAETALTRAEQDLLNSTYDYLTALARLNFAIGLPPAGSVAATQP